MATRRINRSIQALDMETVKRYLNAPTRREDDPGFEVCQSTKDDWDRYVLSENQALHSRAMM
ncbi:hypothetical protein V7S43_000443 [Phytophthora oleae]|uniref:Uncharacterized protein n=1 Tax=Phytophthora oleae TaxID=2107226 RepID=A0ABD3G8Y3_9STRA